MTPWARRLASTYSLALLGAVIAPVRQNWRPRPRKDGFPLSYYPMFTARRRSTTTVHSLVGVVSPDGTRIRLPHGLAGWGGLNQVRRQITRCVTEERAEELCESVAGELTRRNRSETSPFSEIVSVHVVESRFRLDDCFAGAGLIGEETVLASVNCASRPGGSR